MTEPFSIAIVLENVSQDLVRDLEEALSQSESFELNEIMHAILYPISAHTSRDESSVPWETDAADFYRVLLSNQHCSQHTFPKSCYFKVGRGSEDKENCCYWEHSRHANTILLSMYQQAVWLSILKS